VSRAHHRPALLSAEVLEELQGGGGDPALREEAAHTTARLLVEGARDTEDAATTRRIVALADEFGLETLADLWADSPPDSLPGALWRLYALRQWVHADAAGAARQFAEGRRRAPVLDVVAGVADPPGPDEVRLLVDTLLSGAARGDVATTFERAAAFARVVAVGRAELAADSTGATALGDDGREASELTLSASRLVRTAEQLEQAARHERNRPQGWEASSDSPR